MDPVPPHKRTWTMLNYVTFWVSFLAIFLGHLVIAIVVVLVGTIGARLRVPFPVIARSSFGFWFSYFSVISLIVLSMFWFAIQSYIGSECVYQMLKAIWPSIAHLPNHLPPSANITTSGLLCYFVYWLIQFPFMFFSPQKIRVLFLAKTILVPPTFLAMLIWAFMRVPPNKTNLVPKAVLSGNELLWAWLSAFNSAIGFFATAGVNMPDFTRYAKNERAQYIQLVVIPITFTLVSFIGIAVTSAGIVLYGEVLWDPLKLIDHWDNRACAFFTSLAFVLSTLSTNVSANSLSAGNDMAVLYPRYINIRRGQVICAFLGGWALSPWKILSRWDHLLDYIRCLDAIGSAPGFLSFVNGYTVFIAPITGIILTDYWLVHRTRVDVPAMYRPRGRYWYTYGVNWRAAVAMAVSVPPTLPGFIDNVKGTVSTGAGPRLFDMAFMLGFALASAVYFTLSKLLPAHDTVLDHAILELETPKEPGNNSGSCDGLGDQTKLADVEKIA
ncbi:cytosine-purine permease [Russula dissimulans]|nr:cytosine-purine permease [Russula dissimulans]